MTIYANPYLAEMEITQWVLRKKAISPISLAVNLGMDWLALVQFSPVTEEKNQEKALLSAILTAAKAGHLDVLIEEPIQNKAHLQALTQKNGIKAVIIFGKKIQLDLKIDKEIDQLNLEQPDGSRVVPIIVTHSLLTLIEQPELKRQTWHSIKQVLSQ